MHHAYIVYIMYIGDPRQHVQRMGCPMPGKILKKPEAPTIQSKEESGQEYKQIKPCRPRRLETHCDSAMAAQKMAAVITSNPAQAQQHYSGLIPMISTQLPKACLITWYYTSYMYMIHKSHKKINSSGRR